MTEEMMDTELVRILQSGKLLNHGGKSRIKARVATGGRISTLVRTVKNEYGTAGQSDWLCADGVERWLACDYKGISIGVNGLWEPDAKWDWHNIAAVINNLIAEGRY